MNPQGFEEAEAIGQAFAIERHRGGFDGFEGSVVPDRARAGVGAGILQGVHQRAALVERFFELAAWVGGTGEDALSRLVGRAHETAT